MLNRTLWRKTMLVGEKAIHLLMPVSVLDLLRFWLNVWKESVEANVLSNWGARNWLLTCHLG